MSRAKKRKLLIKSNKPEWCKKSEGEVTMEELMYLLEEWQHRLGLCDLGVELERTEGWEGYVREGVNERHFIVGASNERVLVHELLELLLLSESWKERNRIVFQLTNALLRLKYEGGKKKS